MVSGVDPLTLRRKKKDKAEEDDGGRKHVPVSAGPIDKVIDYVFNPSRDKLREVTIIDRIQGRLFPLLDVINLGQQYILEIAMCRQDKDEYKKNFKRARPIPPNFIDEMMFRTAQWQKSVAGKNLERAIDIALAETEARAGEDEDEGAKSDPFRD